MHAWKHPDEQFEEADTYAWCRGGASAEKRFHVFVCAECTAPPCTSVATSPTDGDSKHVELKGLSLMISGVATLQNIALYTSDETAVKVARCGGVKVLADLLSHYEEEQVVLAVLDQLVVNVAAGVFVDTFSNVDRPASSALRKLSDGSLVRHLYV